MKYKIISFKNYSGSGVGFLKSDYSIEDLENELLHARKNEWMYNYCCRFGKKYDDEFTDRCETCFWCCMNYDVEEFEIIGETESLEITSLINFQDKFYWNGGDCC